MYIKEMTKLFDLSASIDKATAALQTRTCEQVLRMLRDMPGIILGDDVGMGKTYISIGTAVWFLVKYPDKPVIIITPGWLLNTKWHHDLRNFIDKNLHRDQVDLSDSDVYEVTQGAGTYISQLADAAEKKAKVLLIPINVFASMGWKYEKSFFLSCWFKHRRFWGKTREQILKALGGDTSVYAPEEFTNMGITYEEIPENWYEELDQIYQESGVSPQGVSHLWNSLKELRYRAISQVMPQASLLILDEAHKLKNQETVKRRALEAAVWHKFARGIFLTATPFQLGEGELRSVLDMFRSAHVAGAGLAGFDGIVSELFLEMAKYQEQMSRFEVYVHALSPDEGALLEQVIESGQVENIGFDIRETYELYRSLVAQKNGLEAILKKLMIRNVKPKDEYRREIIGSLDNREQCGIPLSSEAYIPFALMEKALYEILARGDRTFIANVKQSFTSSFEAVQNASIYERDLEAIHQLRRMDFKKIAHPKLSAVVDEVVKALENGEKTLLFCDRIETISQLKKSMNERLNRSFDKSLKKLFPGNGLKGFENYCKRFYNKQDVAWFLLQESYIHSVLVPVLKLCGKNRKYIPEASDIAEEVVQTYKKYNVTVKANYMYIKRIVEQLVFERALAKISGWQEQLAGYPELLATVRNILDADYIEFGINLQRDLDEEDSPEEENTTLRNISKKLIHEVIQYKGIWHIYQAQLNKLPPAERDALVSSMIQFLRRDRRFFIKLRYQKVAHPDKEDSLLLQRTFSSGSLLDWDQAFQRFLDRYCNETAANREEMQLGLASSEVVAIIHGGTEISARKKIKAGFNTPFYPQILIATATMQEGIDLQVECKRVIHYDLEWNPASLEQRVGRIDRIGSLISKLREKGHEVTLDVYYPYIKNTIDESIYHTVKDREKWFNLLLGGTPQWDTFEMDPDVTPIKPWVFRSLQIDLGV